MGQTFRQTLVSKLQSISGLTALVGGAIYVDTIPQTHDLGAQGPALTYTIPTMPRGQVLFGLDGTAMARVQLSAWSYTKAVSDAITLAILPVLNAVPIQNPWGDGSIIIRSVTHADETDITEKAPGGSDRYIYQIASEYNISYFIGYGG
jgi:hypothetical protein